MKTIDTWIAEYAQSHQNPVNIWVHKLTIPMICLGALMMILHGLALSFAGSLLLVLGLSASYLRFGPKVALYMTVYMGILWAADILLASVFSNSLGLTWLGLGLFVVGWVFQLIGHKIEGKAPSFMENLNFFHVGPVFVIAPLVVSSEKLKTDT